MLNLPKNIPENIIEKINLSKEYLISIGCKKIILFGSLAEGNITLQSDIDIAVSGVEPGKYLKAVVVLPSLIKSKVDLINFEYISPEFRKIIERDGIKLYEKR